MFGRASVSAPVRVVVGRQLMTKSTSMFPPPPFDARDGIGIRAFVGRLRILSNFRRMRTEFRDKSFSSVSARALKIVRRKNTPRARKPRIRGGYLLFVVLRTGTRAYLKRRRGDDIVFEFLPTNFPVLEVRNTQ